MAYRNTVYGDKQPKNMTDDELYDQLIEMQNAITNTTANSEKYGYTSGPLYQRLYDQAQAEITKRETDKRTQAEQQQIRDLYAGVGNNGTYGPSWAPGNPGYDQAVQGQRNSLDQIYGNQRTLQTNALNNLFSGQRGQAIEEAGAYGNASQPAFRASTLNNIDAQKGQQFTNMLGQLGAAEGQARGNLEQNLFNQGQQANQFNQNLNLNKANQMAGLFQGNNQFNQTFGLQQNQFDANQRQQALNNIFGQQQLDYAKQLGQEQAEQSKSGLGMDMLGGAVGGAGVGSKFGPWGAVIGGLGGAALGGATSKKTRF